jgi:hypothetical protein
MTVARDLSTREETDPEIEGPSEMREALLVRQNEESQRSHELPGAARPSEREMSGQVWKWGSEASRHARGVVVRQDEET